MRQRNSWCLDRNSNRSGSYILISDIWWLYPALPSSTQLYPALPCSVLCSALLLSPNLGSRGEERRGEELGRINPSRGREGWCGLMCAVWSGLGGLWPSVHITQSHSHSHSRAHHSSDWLVVTAQVWSAASLVRCNHHYNHIWVAVTSLLQLAQKVTSTAHWSQWLGTAQSEAEYLTVMVADWR